MTSEKYTLMIFQLFGRHESEIPAPQILQNLSPAVFDSFDLS